LGTDELVDIILDDMQLDDVTQLNSAYNPTRSNFWRELEPASVSANYAQETTDLISSTSPEKQGSVVLSATSLRKQLLERKVLFHQLYGTSLEDMCREIHSPLSDL
jgi:hypothetical protein